MMTESKALTASAALIALLLAGCSGSNEPEAPPAAPAPPESTSPPPAPPSLTERLASSSRAAEDRGRDENRKPAEVIATLGIEPGMRVIDVIAAGGYYTEVLSHAVGPEGHVSAQNPAVILQMRDGVNEKALSARLADNRLSNVSRLDAELADLTAADGLYDAGITALNLHDILGNYGEEGAVGAMRTIHGLLKPGGVFGVIDHAGNEGNDNKALHRMLVADAIRIAEASGFEVEANSGILHMHSDDMTQNVFAEGLRGKTSRFLLKLRKPAD